MKNLVAILLVTILLGCNVDKDLRITPVSPNESNMFALRHSRDSILLFFPTTYRIKNRSLNTIRLISVSTNSKVQNGNLAYSFSEEKQPLFSTGKLVTIKPFLSKDVVVYSGVVIGHEEIEELNNEELSYGRKTFLSKKLSSLIANSDNYINSKQWVQKAQKDSLSFLFYVKEDKLLVELKNGEKSSNIIRESEMKQ